MKTTILSFLIAVLLAVSPMAFADKGDEWHQKYLVPYPLLHASGHGDIAEVNRLIAAEADVNAADNNSNTPLHLAAFGGHAEVAKVLIAAGANVNAANNGGSTALHWTAQYGHAEVAKVLILAGANVNAANNNGITVLSLAKYKGHTAIIKILKAEGRVSNQFYAAVCLLVAISPHFILFNQKRRSKNE